MPVNFDWKKEVMEDTVSHNKTNNAIYKIKDVWTKKAVGNTGKPFSATVPAHDVVMLRLSK